MIKLTGSLTIRIIKGKYGDFRVGKLQTEIGEFAVKDSMFDQYDEGRYGGYFLISRIYNGSYSVSSRVVVQLCADIHSVELSNESIEQQQAESFEQDPIEKESPALDKAQNTPPPVDNESDLGYPTEPSESVVTQKDSDSDAALFGALWPLSDHFKIDSTVDRKTFRLQRDRLHELGYTFKAIGQVWLKPE